MLKRHVIATFVLFAGCLQPQPSKSDAERSGGDKADTDATASPEQPDTKSDPAAQLAGFGPMARMLQQKLSEPGPYDEPRKSAHYADGKPYTAVLEIRGSLLELEPVTLFGSGGDTLLVRDLERKLDELAADTNVEGLIVRFGDIDSSLAAATEVRDALLRFRSTTNRKIDCHTEMAEGAAYHLMTACDHLGLAPGGVVAITGAAATPVHIKGLLDRLGIVADFLHIGAYKGAAEPLTRTKPSKELLETYESIVDAQYTTYVDAIASGRKLDPEIAKQRIDVGLFHDAAAKEANLVDTIAIYETFRDAQLGERAWKKIDFRKSPTAEGFDMQALMRFVGVLPQERPTQPHVALVYAVGNVIDGHGDGIIGARMQIASRTLSSTLRALQRDETVKAVVLRVDSPGGSALASEQIARAVADLKAVKPVVVSMGTLAASGGYYISAGATKIFATPNTLTGSIGVVGGKLALGKGLARLGIDTYSVTRGKHAGLWSVTTVWSKEERELVLALMKQTYDLFVNHVAEGRGKTSEEIDAVAQGRIWTGKAALEAGLVDELGGLHAALSEAHRLAGLDPTTQLEIYPPKPTLQDLLESSGGFPLAQVYGATWDELAARALGAVSPDMESIVRSMLERLAMLDAHPVLVTDFALHG